MVGVFVLPTLQIFGQGKLFMEGRRSKKRYGKEGRNRA
jgi:hypothetical protein